MFDQFFLKTRLVSCLPDSPTNCSKPKAMALLALGNVTIYPKPILPTVGSYVIGTNTTPNDTPNHPCSWALEEEVIYIFNLITETAGWISCPLSLNHIIFGQGCPPFSSN